MDIDLGKGIAWQNIALVKEYRKNELLLNHIRMRKKIYQNIKLPRPLHFITCQIC